MSGGKRDSDDRSSIVSASEKRTKTIPNEGTKDKEDDLHDADKDHDYVPVTDQAISNVMEETKRLPICLMLPFSRNIVMRSWRGRFPHPTLTYWATNPNLRVPPSNNVAHKKKLITSSMWCLIGIRAQRFVTWRIAI